MSSKNHNVQEILERAIAGDRVHSAYLFVGPSETTRQAALLFARALACTHAANRPCEECLACRRSTTKEEIALDGEGKKGPLFRHIGDHPDLFWVERGADDTRVRIGQVRAVQSALRFQANEGGRRAVVIADAEWLNSEAQNALLRLLEEPPPKTSLILLSTSASSLLVTVRSRCQRFTLAANTDVMSTERTDEVDRIHSRLAGIGRLATPALLDWAEQFRGERAVAAAELSEFLEVSALWLRDRVRERARQGANFFEPELSAFTALHECRKALVQRNANPQMMAERALLALREATRAA